MIRVYQARQYCKLLNGKALTSLMKETSLATVGKFDNIELVWSY